MDKFDLNTQRVNAKVLNRQQKNCRFKTIRILVDRTGGCGDTSARTERCLIAREYLFACLRARKCYANNISKQ